jgi:hypothetical protein
MHWKALLGGEDLFADDVGSVTTVLEVNIYVWKLLSVKFFG